MKKANGSVNDRNPVHYHGDALPRVVCQVCGEHLEGRGYVYRGKAVCSSCVDYIRSNF